jgi:SAM-dependent methyltransferase
VTLDPAERARSFGAVAAAYEAGRPGYPEELLRECVPDGARRVLDLGAGTGKLSRGLLALGLEVVAVEPDAQLRALIPAGVEVLDGTAEAIPLGDDSVDAVVVGQAFHWFDRERAEAEMRRVVRPGGTIAALWNTFDDRVEWVKAIADALYLEDRLSLVPKLEVFPGERRVMVEHTDRSDIDRLLANAASRSVVSLRPDAEREALLARVRELAPAGEFDVPYVCDAHIARA